ncbi:MAG: nucleoside recognition protein, partial [Candidatus Altarchaeaceae archaeon]
MITDSIISALNYLLFILPFIVIGVVLAELIVELKLVDKIVWITEPIIKFGHLRKECGITFLTAFLSPAAANAVLVDLYNKKIIMKKELFISSLINSFPVVVMEGKFILPIIVPLLGFVGLIYFGILMLIGLIQTLLVLITGKFLLPKRNNENKNDGRSMEKEIKRGQKIGIRKAFKISLQKSRETLKKIILRIVPTTFAVFMLIDIGFFKILADYLSGIAGFFPIPSEGISIIVGQIADRVVGYTIAGNLLSQGILNTKEIILTLLIGHILSSLPHLRITIPYYFGIFGPKDGIEILT